MKTAPIILVSLVMLAAPLMQTAHATTLSNSEIVEAVSDKTIRLASRWGSFPLYYNPNKQVTGNGKSLGLARFAAPKETGRWRVTGGRLCQKFPTWLDGRENCFTLERDGSDKLKWLRQDGASGTATVEN